MKYALDTNIIIRYLRNEPIIENNFDDAALRDYEMIIPKMVDYEIRRGFSITPSPKKEAGYKVLVEQCPVTEMDEESWEKAIQIYKELYKKGFTVGEMDVLIAAFCLVHGYALVTNNIKDFKNIDGLKLVDWTQSQV